MRQTDLESARGASVYASLPRLQLLESSILWRKKSLLFATSDMNLRDVLGDKCGEDIEKEIGYAMVYLRENGWKELRSFSEFFSVFKLPQLHKMNIEERVITNFLHYRSNYIAISVGLSFLRLLYAPFLLLSVLCVLLFWSYLLVFINKPLIIGDLTISNNGKIVICSVTSLVFLAMCGALEQILWTILYCIVVCALHMFFRPRSVTSKSGKLYDELKLKGFSWFGGESHELEDPESALTALNDDAHPFSGMTSASVRKRTALGPSTSNIGAGKVI